MTDTADAILDRLVELDRTIHAHYAAAYLLEIERDERRRQLRVLGWQAPPLKVPA